MFQFTHPQGVRRLTEEIAQGMDYVSIHAPARGATQLYNTLHGQYAVSIHAPARGATPPHSRSTDTRSSFNSRTRKGCDTSEQADGKRISVFQFTHPQGVRLKTAPPRGGGMRFQFTHPQGVRLCLSHALDVHSVFQFTHPQGVRHGTARTGQGGVRFNSRTRKGCDTVAAPHSRQLLGFNSRTRKGCDYTSKVESLQVRSFNSRTRKGCDPLIVRHGHGIGCFNSRTRKGCDSKYGEVAVGLPLQTYFSEGTQIIPSIRCRKHLKSYNRMSMSACECLANSCSLHPRRLRSALRSDDQLSLRLVTCLPPVALYVGLVVLSEVIDPQAIPCLIDNAD